MCDSHRKPNGLDGRAGRRSENGAVAFQKLPVENIMITHAHKMFPGKSEELPEEYS
jgi:hypothetical protein